MGDPRPNHGTIQRANGGNPRDGAQLTKEEEEEALRQGEQVIRGMKQLGCAMVLLPATIITRRLLTNVWNSWCIVMIIVIATQVRAQDLETPAKTDELPPQVRKGMDMSHQAYQLEAFDCDKPEDVLTQSVPQGCAVGTPDDTDPDANAPAKQDYTILQKVATFEYPATLCTLCRSHHYYDCV